MKSRFLIFAVLGPAVAFLVLTLSTVLLTLAQGGGSAHTLSQTGKVFQHLLSPGGLVLWLLLAVPALGAAALSRPMEEARTRGRRVLAGLAALALISPATFVTALIVGSGWEGPAIGVASSVAALAGCCWLAKANDGLRLRPTTAVFD